MARKALSWSKLFSKASSEDLPLTPEAKEFVADMGNEALPQPQRVLIDAEPNFPELDKGSTASSSYEAHSQTMVQDAPLQPEDLGTPKVSLWQKTKQAAKGQIKAGGRSLRSGAATLQVQAKTQVVQTLRTIGPMALQHRWTLFSIGVLLTAGGLTVGSLIWLSQVPPATDCKKIGPFSVETERLQCAQQATLSGKAEDYLQAIALVKDWSVDHPLYGRGQRALEQWSDGLMLVARERLAANDLDGAMKLAEQVPTSSSRYKEVRDTIGRWQEERNRGQKLFDKIQAALKQQYWDEASGLLAKLALVDDPIWQTRLTDLRRQLDNEKKAGVLLKQSQEFIKANPTQTWGKAIETLLGIDTKTFVWQKAKNEIDKLRDAMFKLAATRMSKKDVKGADEVIKSLPLQVAITGEQRDLTRVVYASTVDGKRENREPIFDQMVQVLTASAQVQQVSPDSPFHQSATVLVPRLQMHIEDAVQMQMAQALASFGQVNMLQGAIAQAQGISSKRPRRLEAQTLVAQWTKGVQRLEDRPIVLQAQQVAKVGGLDQLRSAVALVDRLTKGRVLYSEAQSRRGEWVAQIQTIEDKPILNEARGLAQSGQLGKAIQVASRIKYGRALYGEAQGSIGGWAAEIQAIQDRATLARAEGLAAQGSLTQAIEVASQVRGSAVGGEAQASIDRWSSERQQIRNDAPPPVEAAPPEPIYSEPDPPPPEPYYEPPAAAAPPPPEPEPIAPEPAPAAPEPAPPPPEAEPAPPP